MDADASVKSRRFGRAQAIWSTLTEDVSAGGRMSPGTRLEKALRIDDLRTALLEHSRRAYSLIPKIDRPRILDIGCGSGLLTIELARMSAGDVVGIDVDESAIERLRLRAEQAGPSRRISALNASLFDTGFPDDSFDILWGEGVLHTLDPCRSFPASRRLLKLGGFLVAGETVSWFESVRRRLGTFGFRLVEQHLLPKHCWWTDYYVPLEANIRVLRARVGARLDPAELARYESEIAMVRADPDRFDCGFFILQKD